MTDLFADFDPPTRFPRPQEPIIRAADIEAPYRWSMRRAWGSGPTVMWTLFNPSDADATRDDPTTLRMMQFSLGWGFGSMIVTNVYPFIASKPADLVAWRRTFDHKAYEAIGMPIWETGLDRGSWSAFLHNQRLISGLVQEGMTCVAAWGEGPTDADLENFLFGIGFAVDDEEHGRVHIPPSWHCIGTTTSGRPIHPLARGRSRVPEGTELRKWRTP